MVGREGPFVAEHSVGQEHSPGSSLDLVAGLIALSCEFLNAFAVEKDEEHSHVHHVLVHLLWLLEAKCSVLVENPRWLSEQYSHLLQ